MKVTVERLGHLGHGIASGPQGPLYGPGVLPGEVVEGDPSGDRLRDWMGVDDQTFYADPRLGVAAQAFCYPGTAPKGGDYPPPPRCAALWRPRLLANLPNVELTLLVGGHAQTWALGDRAKATMTETVRAWRDYGPAVLPLPHPSWRNSAWLRRNPWFEAEVVPHLRARVREVLA